MIALNLLAAVAAGTIYALAARSLYQRRRLKPVLEPFTAGHIIGLPLAAGFVSTLTATSGGLVLVVLPLAVTALYFVAVLALRWQRLLSVLLNVPAFLLMSIVGSALAFTVHSLRPGAITTGLLAGLIAATPIFWSMFESGWPARRRRIKVRTNVLIAADPDDIWERIVRVAPIRSEEWSAYRLFALLGFPAPERADLDFDGPGGLRLGIFSNRVLFEEPVAGWRPGRRVAFHIRVNADAVAALPFDKFTRIGGEYFGLERAEYVLEPLAGGFVRLHLNSVQHVNTRFNSYAGFWGRLILSAFQRNILALVRTRCEQVKSTRMVVA